MNRRPIRELALVSIIVLSALACDMKRIHVQRVGAISREPTLTIVPDSFAAPTTHPMFLVTPARRATWARMKSDGHWLYRLAQKNCAASLTPNEPYYDIGRWCAWIYQVNGDSAAARRAIVKLTQMKPTPGQDFNWLRESYVDYAIVTDWVWNAMSDAERTMALGKLNGWAAWALGKDGGGGFMRTTDSDQLHGSYFGLALTDILQRNLPGAPRWLDSVMTGAGQPVLPMGGLKITSPNRETSARNAIAWYAGLAKGGSWNESSEYNLGTMKLLVQGVDAINTALGSDYFPEFTALFRDVARYQVFTITPDLSQASEWGDLEHPHDFHSRMYDQVVLDGMLVGVTRDAGLHRLLLDLWAKYGTQGSGTAEPAINGWRMLPMYDPYVEPAAQEPMGGWPVPGRGQLLVRVGRSLFFGEEQNNSAEDHQIYYLHNLSLYREGEWVLDHPRGYQGDALQAMATNGVSYAGMGAAGERGLVRFDSGAGWWSITGKTGGPSTGPDYYDPPPAFLKLGLRTALYTQIAGADVVVTFDTVSPQPLRATRVDRYYAVSQPLMQSITALANDGFAAVWHAPVKPTPMTGGYTWATPGGQTIQLYAFGDGVNSVTIDEMSGTPAFPGGGGNLALRGWMMRFHMTGPTLFTVAVVGRGTLPPVTRVNGGVQVGTTTILMSSAAESVK